MRLLAFGLLLFVSTTAAAAPSHLYLGGDVGLLFRDEAGGNRTVLPSLSPRLSYELKPNFNLLAQYSFAYSPSSSQMAAVSTQHHRVAVGAEYAIPVRAAAFFAGAGVANVMMRTTIADDKGDSVSTMITRPAFWAELGLEVRFPVLRIRADVQLFEELGRHDLMTSIGALYPFGGAR